jgi:histone H2A
VEALHHLMKCRLSLSIDELTPVYVAAVLEYLTAEVVELSGNAAKEDTKTTISVVHLHTALRGDEALLELTSNAGISF